MLCFVSVLLRLAGTWVTALETYSEPYSQCTVSFCYMLWGVVYGDESRVVDQNGDGKQTFVCYISRIKSPMCSLPLTLQSISSQTTVHMLWNRWVWHLFPETSVFQFKCLTSVDSISSINASLSSYEQETDKFVQSVVGYFKQYTHWVRMSVSTLYFLFGYTCRVMGCVKIMTWQKEWFSECVVRCGRCEWTPKAMSLHQLQSLYRLQTAACTLN